MSIRVLACDVSQPVFRIHAVARYAAPLGGARHGSVRHAEQDETSMAFPPPTRRFCRQTEAELGGRLGADGRHV